MGAKGKSAGAGVGTGVIAMRVIAVVLALIAGYLGVLWFQLGATLASGGDLEDGASASVTALSAEIDAFRGDPESAAELLPKLEDGLAEIGRMRADIGGIGARLLPPLGSASDDYQAALRAYATHVEDYYVGLSRIGEFVTGRADVMTQAGEGLKVLGDLSKAGITNDDVARIIGEARVAVDESVSQLRSMAASSSGGTSVYSSDALLARLTTLSNLLQEIEQGIAAADATRVRTATQGFSKLMQADWQTLFLAADQEGLAQFGSKLTQLRGDRDRIAAARDDIAATRTALGAAAIGLAVIALLAAAVAWLR